ncbi:MAG: LysM peptidoglycan-binding domain-containing protein [Bacteroidota bacterium]
MMNTLLLILTLGTSLPADSLRTEIIEGKTYIIHRVEKKETLFSISKRYGVAMALVVDANKGSDSGIEAGEELRVPYAGAARTRTKDGIIHTVGERQTLYSIAKQYGVTVDDLKAWNKINEQDFKPGVKLVIRDKPKPEVTPGPVTPVETVAPLPKPAGGDVHTVAEKETLFAISRKYKVAVNDLIKWNNLKSNDLKSGQKIFVSDPGSAAITNAPVQSAKSASPVSDPNTVRIKPVQSDEVHENGLAAVMPGTGENRKYLGYHRSIKPGTVLRVRNTATQKEIFVRIIGTLPAGESADVVLRITRIAADKLGTEEKIPVELVYFP